MPTIFYECLNDKGLPATARQRKLLGTKLYGYVARWTAEAACPPGCSVRTRYADRQFDWSGEIISIRTIEGQLIRLG